MACWLNLISVDPMLESENGNLLASLGTILRTAGISESGEETVLRTRRKKKKPKTNLRKSRRKRSSYRLRVQPDE
ncbi:hypothetical protein R1sor_001798 [Riccia sorocarpa]|uniref:Uncharacterized protein n=1 Tax=Riccia sorocarpa TaxID=122646 RepID=A0ABD3GYY6_9MARC